MPTPRFIFSNNPTNVTSLPLKQSASSADEMLHFKLRAMELLGWFLGILVTLTVIGSLLLGGIHSVTKQRTETPFMDSRPDVLRGR
jgi:hypothetical protein